MGIRDTSKIIVSLLLRYFFMGRKAKYSKELKLEIVKRYLKGESAISLANEYGMTYSMRGEIRKWANKTKSLGENSLNSSPSNKAYSKELKQQVINDYINGIDSLEGLVIKYDISTHGIVRQWIIKYNKGIEIKDYNPKGDVYTMKSRKTTLEERLEIVNYVLANNNDFKGAADKYSVPYANVYNWVKKYNEAGCDGCAVPVDRVPPFFRRFLVSSAVRFGHRHDRPARRSGRADRRRARRMDVHYRRGGASFRAGLSEQDDPFLLRHSVDPDRDFPDRGPVCRTDRVFMADRASAPVCRGGNADPRVQTACAETELDRKTEQGTKRMNRSRNACDA